MIIDHDTANNGYNTLKPRPSSNHAPIGNYTIFNPNLNLKELYQKYEKPSKHFCRFPTLFVRCDIQKKYGISRVFYVVYYLIDKSRSLDDTSWITIESIYRYCNYSKTKRKSKVFFQIVDCLKFMRDNGMLRFFTDLDSLNYDTGIEIKIIAENFDFPDKWIRLTHGMFEKIMLSDSSISKENLLLAFLYVNSYIGHHPRDPDGNEKLINPSSSPEAFFKNLHVMSDDIAMSRDTVTRCMQDLVSIGLLKKKTVGSIKKDNKPPQNVPNIYVINQVNYEQEILWALDKLRGIYQVESFGPLC